MMKKLYPVLAIQLLACVGLQQAVAAKPAKPSMMEKVVVTASRDAETKKKVSAHLTIIEREEIALSTGRNVGDLLAEKGLGHIQKYPGSLTSVAIRGFRTDTHGNDLQGHVLVLLDGRRAGSGNVAKILTANVERIEIIRGPGAVQYGSAGMGGVINIITRRGTKNSFTLSGGADSFGSFDTDFGATFQQNGFDFSGSLTYRTLEDYTIGGGDTYENTGTDSETGFSANLGYTFSGNHRIGLTATGFFVSGAGSPGYFSMVDSDDTTEKKNTSIDLSYTGGAGSYNWLVRYFLGRDENSWQDPVASNPDRWDNGIDSTNETDQQGAQAQITGVYGNTTLTGGFDWLGYGVENSWAPRETDYSNGAVFILGKSSFLGDRLTANFGLRYDWFKLSMIEPAGRDEETSHLTPKIGLSWMVNDRFKLRAQYAQGFMIPSADQLAADFVGFSGRTVGNPDLEPEKSSTYEAGFEYEQSGFQASATYFYTDFEDMIETTYRADGSKTWQNIGSATISGLEAELSYDLGVPLKINWEVRPYLNLTQMVTYEDNETGDNLKYISPTTISTGIVVSNGDDFTSRFNVAYTSSQDVEDWESGVFPTPVIELDSYVVADLTATYRLMDHTTWGRLSIRGEIKNLFDEEYAYVNGYPMPGRSFYLGLTWEY